MSNIYNILVRSFNSIKELKRYKYSSVDYKGNIPPKIKNKKVPAPQSQSLQSPEVKINSYEDLINYYKKTKPTKNTKLQIKTIDKLPEPMYHDILSPPKEQVKATTREITAGDLLQGLKEKKSIKQILLEKGVIVE